MSRAQPPAADASWPSDGAWPFDAKAGIEEPSCEPALRREPGAVLTRAVLEAVRADWHAVVQRRVRRRRRLNYARAAAVAALVIALLQHCV